MTTGLTAGAPVAAGLDWLEGLLPILFVVIWIVSQVVNLLRGARRPEARQPPPPAAPAAGQRDAIDVDREIEEFLRRTLAPGTRPTPSSPAATAARGRPPQAPVAEPPPLPAATRRPIRERTGGGDVAAHVKEAFAGDLAHQQVAGATAAPPGPSQHRPAAASAAVELVATLRRSGGLRQLMLVHEVLARPTHRW